MSCFEDHQIFRRFRIVLGPYLHKQIPVFNKKLLYIFCKFTGYLFLLLSMIYYDLLDICISYLVYGCRTYENENIDSLTRIAFSFLAGSSESEIFLGNLNALFVVLCNAGRCFAFSNFSLVSLLNFCERYIKTNLTVDEPD